MNEGLRQLLLAQAGVVSRAQAIELKVTRRQIDQLVATGAWLRVRPAVFRLSTAVPTAEASLRAASLWLGAETLLSGPGAAWWWGCLPEPPDDWHFLRPTGTTTCRGPGVQVGRCFVDPVDQTSVRGVAVLDRPLALLRAAVDLEAQEAGRGIGLLDRAAQLRWARRTDLERALGRHQGTWGSATMRRLLDRTGDGAHSELERMAVRLLRAAGITGFVLNHRTTLPGGRRVELDVAFPDRRIALELDGYAYHASPEALRRDLNRANDVMAAGWTLRRFTYADLLGDPDGFVAAVGELLVS